MPSRHSLLHGFAVVTLLLTFAGMTHLGHVGSNASPAAVPDIDVTLADQNGRLIPLNPGTLADAPAGQPLDLDVGAAIWDITRSGDGSTLATVAPSGVGPASNVTIVIRDGRTGAARLRFHPPVAVSAPHLSDDGTRLVVERVPDGASFGWLVFDTRDGSLLAIVNPPDGWAEAVVDRQARRLYYFAQPTLSLPPGDDVPPAVLVAYDLTTGSELARVTLNDVRHGYQYDEEEMNDGLPGHVLEAGLAVSPDSRQLAIAPADRDEVLLLDAESLSIQRTLALTRPVSTADRLLGYLGLAPQTAEAKSFDGIKRRISYRPDGRHVVLYGSQETTDPDVFRQWSSGLGLTIVDVATGEIVAEGLEGELIRSVQFTPDGSQLFTTGPAGGRELVAWVTEPEGYVRSYVIRRLDATTLEPLAERELATYPRLLLAPNAPDSH